jgi:hypothetical protein
MASKRKKRKQNRRNASREAPEFDLQEYGKPTPVAAIEMKHAELAKRLSARDRFSHDCSGTVAEAEARQVPRGASEELRGAHGAGTAGGMA